MLEERLHADAGVVGGEHLGEQLLLEVEAAVQGDVEARGRWPAWPGPGRRPGPAASSAALARARSSTSSGARPRRPGRWRSASSAPTWRPVKIRSLARAGPTSRARRCVPPPPGMMPSRISGWPSLAFSLAMRKSQARASSQPPPSAKPEIAAIVARGMAATALSAPQEGWPPSSAWPATSSGPRAELGDLGAGGEDPVAAGDHDRARRVVVQRRRRPLASWREQLRRRARSPSGCRGADGHAVVAALDVDERRRSSGMARTLSAGQALSRQELRRRRSTGRGRAVEPPRPTSSSRRSPRRGTARARASRRGDDRGAARRRRGAARRVLELAGGLEVARGGRRSRPTARRRPRPSAAVGGDDRRAPAVGRSVRSSMLLEVAPGLVDARAGRPC